MKCEYCGKKLNTRVEKLSGECNACWDEYYWDEYYWDEDYWGYLEEF